jgi:hypothetical protein
VGISQTRLTYRSLEPPGGIRDATDVSVSGKITTDRYIIRDRPGRDALRGRVEQLLFSAFMVSGIALDPRA